MKCSDCTIFEVVRLSQMLTDVVLEMFEKSSNLLGANHEIRIYVQDIAAAVVSCREAAKLKKIQSLSALKVNFNDTKIDIYPLKQEHSKVLNTENICHNLKLKIIAQIQHV